MSVAIVSGSGGLIGGEMCNFLLQKGFEVHGIDNDMRSYFFGNEASTNWNVQKLLKHKNYKHHVLDIRNYDELSKLFKNFDSNLCLIVHTAAQPSHYWAAKEPLTDFGVNALGTLNMLEATRLNSPNATFIFTSTNKVYGDLPNYLPLVEKKFRWEVDESNVFFKNGIDETMSIDQCKHSVFGASKVSADVMVQEYGKYFGLKTGVFRGGCLTGPAHSGAELHGFLAYLIKCFILEKKYTIFGYGGKQVRDNIHSRDLISAFWYFHENPRPGEVYNIGGSRHSNISMLEAINFLENSYSKKLDFEISEQNRIGDHIWYISDVNKFKSHYPNWNYTITIEETIREMVEAIKSRC